MEFFIRSSHHASTNVLGHGPPDSEDKSLQSDTLQELNTLHSVINMSQHTGKLPLSTGLRFGTVRERLKMATQKIRIFQKSILVKPDNDNNWVHSSLWLFQCTTRGTVLVKLTVVADLPFTHRSLLRLRHRLPLCKQLQPHKQPQLKQQLQPLRQLQQLVPSPPTASPSSLPACFKISKIINTTITTTKVTAMANPSSQPRTRPHPTAACQRLHQSSRLWREGVVA